MPYLKPSATDLLTLPSDPSYTVTMKRRAAFGDIEAARGAMIQVDANISSTNQQVDAKVEYANYVQEVLLRLIVAWTLDDESGQPLAITATNINKLDPIDGDFLAAEAKKRSTLRPQVQEVPFEKPSGESSPATQ